MRDRVAMQYDKPPMTGPAAEVRLAGVRVSCSIDRYGSHGAPMQNLSICAAALAIAQFFCPAGMAEDGSCGDEIKSIEQRIEAKKPIAARPKKEQTEIRSGLGMLELYCDPFDEWDDSDPGELGKRQKLISDLRKFADDDDDEDFF